MNKRTGNRLWVRFSLAIIGIIFIVTVLPAASLLLVTSQEIVSAQKEQIETLNEEAALGLSAAQINVLAQDRAYAARQTTISDIQFLTLTTLIVGVLAGVLLGRGLSAPIERLVTATQAVASQELAHWVEVKGAQEIVELADNFNRMTASLARSEEVRRNMLADVSHELLTPLTVLQGNLRAILDGVYALNKEEIGKLYVQSKHLIRLVRDLRQLSQAEAGQLSLQITAVDLNALITETAAIFLPLAQEKNVALTCQLGEDLPPIPADSHRLRQVLHNLLANALRHTPADGQITISTTLLADEIRLTISDTGEGIAPELQPHVFDRFYRTEVSRRRDSGGAGLGLAISRGIVLAHNGRIEAASPGVNQGSTFSICLPVEDTKPAKTRPSPRPQ